ncbi:MAG: PKD domain-containing protein, partial [Candidatus Bathyarchaeota archaeon]
NKPPVAVIGDPPSPVYINETVSFDASNSSDPEGPISHYYWDMGDGAIYNTTSSSVTHSYSDSGVYSITLTVTDDGGKTNTTTTTITVKEENEAPQASFTFLPTFPEVDETVTFDASNSFDPDGTIASYEWDFGDGNTATSITVSHVYDDNGNYSVTLTVTDDEGKNNQTQAIVAVMNRQPTASFTATPETADIGETIFFDASSSSDPDGTIDSYDWDFGDGHTSTDQTPTHTYSQKGTYTVKLTVTDDDGATDTAIISVEVSNQLPVAHLTYSSPSHVYTDKTVSFDASGSHDPDGNIISYVWNFGDENTGSGETISHSYSSSGVYTVSLTVTDNDGATDTATATITVIQNQPPVADAGDIPSDPVDTGEVISFDASHSSDPDGTISRYYWDMGDGKTYNTTSPTVAHSYSDSGVYTITLTVTDDGSKTSTTTTTITVIAAKQSPSASFEVSPTSPNVNETVNFDASDSSDSDGTVEDYVWEFGDGNTATGEIVTHIYSSNGTYTVTLTVTDNDSLTDTATMYVTVVQPVELDVTEPDPKAGEDQTVNAESEVKFDGSESTDNVGIVKYEWDFGDGKTGTGVNVTHAYKEAGNYTVTLTVEDAAGNRKSDTCAITVDGQETPNGEYIGRKPWSLSTVGEVALIGTAAVAASFVMLGHVISSFVPKWNIPNWLKDFLQLYLEDVTETLDKKKATGSEKVPFITKGELAAITVSALIMTAVFSFVETNGLPDFLNLSVLVAVVPSVLIAVLMDNFVEVFAEALCARACKVYRQVNFWMYGLVLFLVSSLLLFFPTGTPIITRYPNGESPDRKMVLIILLKSLILLTVALPFAGLYMLGFRVLGDTGLLMTLMLVFYYSLPVKPVVGKVVFDYNKAVGLSTWVLTGALFFGLLLNILPCIVYLIAGAVSVILAALTLWMLSKSPFETTVPKSNV